MAVSGFQFRGRRGQRVAEIVEGDAVENDGERIGLWRSAAGDGVNTRAQARHFQSCTVSSFLVRVPLRTSLTLLQCGQRLGRFAVCETRARAGARRACGDGGWADCAEGRARGLEADGIGSL